MLEEDGERIYLAAKSPTSRLVGGGGGARTTSSSGRRTLRSYGSCGSQAAQMAARQNVRIVKHCVQSGDTLQGIALKYGVTMEDIKRENRLWTTDSLFLREYLDIPLPSRPIAGILDDSGVHDEGGGDDEKSPPPLSHFVSGSDTAVTESVAPAEAAPTATTTTRTPTAKPAGAAAADTSADLKTKAPKAEAEEESTKTTTTTTSAETTATATTAAAAAAGTTMSSSDSTMATAATTTTSTTTTTTTTPAAAATTKTSTSTSAVCGTAASGKSSSTSSSGCSPGRERRTVSLDVATPTGAVADENIRDFLGRIDTSIQKTKSQIKEFTLSGGDSVTVGGGPVASGTDHASQPAGLSHPASTALGSSGGGPSYQNNGFEDSGDLRPQQDQQQQSLGELSTNGGGVQRGGGGGCGGGSGGCASVDFAPKTTVVTSGRKVKTSLQRHRREHEQMFEL